MKRLGKFNNKFFALLAVLVIAGIGGYIVFSSRAANNIVTNAPAAPTVYISPTSQTIGVNETFTITIKENSGTTAVNAVEANFTYPTNLLDYVPTAAEVTTSNPQGISFVGSVMNPYVASVNTTTGTVNITKGLEGTSITGDQQLAKLTFRSKTAGGVAALNFLTSTMLVNYSTGADLLGGSRYGNASYTIDTTGPTVSITAPANNANVEKGSSQTITATASDASSSVTSVEFLVNGTVVNTDTTSPYSYAWSTTSVALGSYTLTARATDTYNNKTTSSGVIVNVRDSIAPTVSLTAPVAGSTLVGTVSLTANASDNTNGSGLARVEFLVNGTVVNTDTTSPYSYSWNTTTVTDGTYSLAARAFDNATTANSATSTAVSVTVDNSDRTPPTTPGNFRTTGNTFTSVSLAWDASTDNVGVTGYRVTRNGTQVYSGTALTFNDTGLTSGTSYNYAVTAYDEKGNVSAAATLTASSKVQKVGDINGDDIVNVLDLSYMLGKWKTTDASADLNNDGIVNVLDLSRLLANWS
jgi:hypothetical protein